VNNNLIYQVNKIKINDSFYLLFYLIDNFARLTLNEINNKLNGNDNITTNKIATENPILKQTYSHENKTNHLHDASPSPTSGYASSSVHGEGISRDSTSPPSAYVPQHDYLNVN